MLELLDDDDEILLELADVLSTFEEYVGGSNHATCLFKILESFCKILDTNIRDKVKHYLNNKW